MARDFETKVRLARLIADGASTDEAARRVGVGRATAFRWIADDEDMAAAVEAVKFVTEHETKPPLLPLPGKAEGVPLAPVMGSEEMNAKIRRGAGRIVWSTQ